jgi:hypothetical protein
VGGYWIYGYYDDCWYENDIRRRLSDDKQLPLKIINFDENDNYIPINNNLKLMNSKYFGPPTLSNDVYLADDRIKGSEDGSSRQLFDILATKSLPSYPTPYNLLNGYICGGPGA